MNGLLGPEEQKRLVDGLLDEARAFRRNADEQLEKFLGTKYGGSHMKDALGSAAYAAKKFFLTDYEGSRISGLFESVSAAISRSLARQ